MRPSRSAVDLGAAAHHVTYEWESLVGLAAELHAVEGHRTVMQNAALEAFLDFGIRRTSMGATSFSTRRPG